jgi:hypothetical protein
LLIFRMPDPTGSLDPIARSALVQAQARRLSDTAALFTALGGGWWNRNDVTAAAQGPQSALPSGKPTPDGHAEEMN